MKQYTFIGAFINAQAWLVVVVRRTQRLVTTAGQFARDAILSLEQINDLLQRRCRALVNLGCAVH